MSVLAIARASLRRVLRDRTALFFMIVLPVMIILIIGATVRGYSTFHVGVVDLGAGRSGAELTPALEDSPNLSVVHYASLAAATKAVARAEVSTAVILPAGMDTDIDAGRSVNVTVLASPTDSTQQAAAAAVESVVSAQGSTIQAAHFATQEASGTFVQNLARAASIEAQVTQVTIDSRVADTHATVLPQGFSYSAPTMLVLFVFLNAIAGGAVIIETRRLGMYERMSAAPIRTSSIIAGEALTYLTIALMQSGLIIFIGGVVFGVSWGSPLAAALLVAVWALVGAGAGMLSGTLFRTPEQASAIGPALGMAFGMLGGCMWPLSIVNNTMRQVGHATPNAWAVDAWTALLSRGGTVSTIAPDLGVLALFAAGFLALATVRLRKVLL